MKKLVLTLSLMFVALPVNAQVPISFADVAEKLFDCVVNVSTVQETDEDVEHQSLGSGFIISEDGYIVTNLHVIEKATKINVVLANDDEYDANVVGVDKKSDVALLKINPDIKLSPVVIGDSDKVRVGDWILAIGNPFGLGGSLTAGIISAKSRDIEVGPYDNFLQTDASINQGNSGGPMFNLQGEVIGVNSAIFSDTGLSQGIGFASPINQVMWVVNQLKQTGEVKRGYIGAMLQSEDGAGIISSLKNGGPAMKQGLEVGDKIVKFNGKDVKNIKNLSREIAQTKVGENVEIVLQRNNQQIIKNIIIEEQPQEQVTLAKEKEENLFEIYDLGLWLKNETFNVVVAKVKHDGLAAKHGLKEGDRIAKIDGRTIISIKDVEDMVVYAKADMMRPMEMEIDRDEEMHMVKMELINEQN